MSESKVSVAGRCVVVEDLQKAKDRRERIATAVLSGLITMADRVDCTVGELAKDAVRAADLLIKELDREDK